MSKQSSLELVGTVIQELGNSMFKVEIDSAGNPIVVCTISGKIRKNLIRIMAGDKVKLEVSPYDLTKGRIVTRLKDDKVNNNSSNNKNQKKK